jgi:polysaccharide biosynthesis/export protein
MKPKHLTAMLICCILIAASHLWAADSLPATVTEDYVIGPGDVLAISVWDNEELTKVVTVLPDGKIHFPLISELVAGGKTHAAIEKELKKKIDGFVSNPELSVMVQETSSLMIYIIGEVVGTGQLRFNTNINVLKALAMAGGFNDFAKKDKIKIYRESKGRTEIFHFNYGEVVDGENLEQNIRLERGDVVVVP